MIREFKIEDFNNEEIETEKAKEYVAELQKAYDKFNSLVTESSKYFGDSEDSLCIFEYMDVTDSFLNLLSNLLICNYNNVFEDSVYADTTDYLHELQEAE